MVTFRRVCVFCGSNPGARPEYREAAKRMARTLAERGTELVYGGGNVGLMGAIADETLSAGGRVLGVIPEQLEAREVAHRGLTELRVVKSMHERKALMADLSDAFIAMPGGLGTFEEIFEVATWTQLGIHRKPIGFLNVAGYYDHFQQLLARAVEDRFMRPEHAASISFASTPEALMAELHAFQPTHVEKWLDRNER